MASVVKSQGNVVQVVSIRGSGDGMETEDSSETSEVLPETIVDKVHVRHCPQAKSIAVCNQSPGVLQLGKIQADKSIEVEAVRILVPKAAISHVTLRKNGKFTDPSGCHKSELLTQTDDVTDSKKEALELEKLKNSERRLLQDKEGLSNQLKVQTEVNRELKKLLVASVGDDLEYHFERMAREKNQLILENETLTKNLVHTSEQLERMTIQCDVWRSKFLASRVMAEELGNVRTAMQRQIREAHSAIQDLLSEREQFRQEMIETHRLLEQLIVSLQWGRPQTYYPCGQPQNTAELILANQKLAKSVHSHLLGSVNSFPSKKASAPVEPCSTPAEKMAEMVLRKLDPVTCKQQFSEEKSFSASSVPPFLSPRKSIGRFHPYTNYENITFNCCTRCSGELIVL
ncbi:golgin-45 [Protopterus annectens]|uniref:golgin-45 n=1 Tax=Protopterus annectens TaxID=7888 RepID=UPI001CFC38B6|nr:golgin-45 [Protopterus annectens]